jgi:glycosyltransferase involved in cell wall biosynthesis
VFFQGGYATPAFRNLGRLCRLSGGRVVGLSDADWRGSLRQRTVDPLRHHLFLRRGFDGLFVPGRAGAAYARNMGYDASHTLTGVLGADPDVFGGGDRLSARPKTLLFVGRLERIKNVAALATAFTTFVARNPGWRLDIVGEGSLAGAIPRHPNVSVSGFLQPRMLAGKYREARCLVLPSLREPWGLVVHEAALSGCALALSQAVGARHDLASPGNAVVFDPDREAIESALNALSGWNDAQWGRAESISRERAEQFGPRAFADAVDRFVEIFARAK